MSTTTSKNIWNFDPRSVPGCTLWFDAEDKSTLTGTSPVTSWRDKSLYGSNATYSGTPTVTAAINGRKAMYFNGSSYFTGAISGANTTTITVFMVGSLIAPFGGFSGLLCFGNPSQFDYDNDGSLPITMYNDQYKIYGARNSSSQPTPISAGVPFIYALQYDGTYINTWKNGTIQTDPSSNISKSGTFTYTNYAIGSRAGTITGAYLWSGYLGEIIVYQSAVSPDKRQQIEGYLAWKWGLNGNYSTISSPLSVPGCILWLDAGDPNGTGTRPSNGTTLTTWKDKSVSDFPFTSVGSSYNTTAVNGNPGISLSSNYFRYDPGSDQNNWQEVFAVGLWNGGSTFNNYNGFVTGLNSSDGGSATGIIFIGNIGTTSWYPIGNTYTTPVLNGTSTYTAIPTIQSPFIVRTLSASAVSQRGLIIGIDRVFTDRIWQGFVSEVICYNTVLSTTQRNGIERYLANKWGINTQTNILPRTHPFYTIKPYLRIFQPTDILGCILWLDASDKSTMTLSGSNVTQWNDKSGNGNTCSNSTASNSPVFNQSIKKNGLTVLSFTGPGVLNTTTSQWLDNTGMTFPNVSNTIFAVVYNDNSTTKSFTGNNYIISGRIDALLSYSSYTSNRFATFIGNGTSWNSAGTNTPSRDMNGVWSLTAMTLNSNVLTPYFNGTAQDTKAGTMGSTTGFIIGEAMSGYRGQCWNGYIAEILMYNTPLTNDQRQQVEGYLSWKWGVNTSLSNIHPFYRFRSATTLPFLPTNISGIKLWLDGNDPAGTGVHPSAGSLARWIDKSGSSNHMTAVGTSPTFSNYPPGAVYFGGAGYFSNSNAVLSNAYTIFLVYKSTPSYAGPLYTTGASSGYSGLFPSEGGTLFLTRGDSTWYTQSTMLPNDVINLVSVSYTSNVVGSNIELYYNGTSSISTTQSNLVSYSNFLLGSRQSGGTSYFNGLMYEVISYNGTLTTNQRQSVEGYLSQKWKL